MDMANRIDEAREAIDFILDMWKGDDPPDKGSCVDVLQRCVNEVLSRLPRGPDIELAIKANNMGRTDFQEGNCECDPSVGMSPCPYCAIDAVLIRLWRIVDPEAAEKARPRPKD